MSDSTIRQFISFTIGDEEYGVDIMAIREIKGWTETTALPNAPAHMRGVINLRGTIVPILDLRARFGRGVTDASARHVIMVVAVGSRVAGILVDAVADILAVAAESIQPVPALEHAESGFLTGLVTVEGRMVALLDLTHIFAFDEMDAATEAAA
ncbi:chemotaxis protein CheW [Magnetospirillum sp. SS-4]|uniref:chemotaxis protein CheW n=1 Tax=Magnetospirillum sp. SS-4 TaxID=2681465 RepID=UPI00137F53AC|nr:chemotaxis protein CheW [Magnetospirillum sp. SS-4]CAA7618767.1 purine-binding chemotaxis protein [Magnetospirillum sp. SS-4]